MGKFRYSHLLSFIIRKKNSPFIFIRYSIIHFSINWFLPITTSFYIFIFSFYPSSSPRTLLSPQPWPQCRVFHELTCAVKSSWRVEGARSPPPWDLRGWRLRTKFFESDLLQISFARTRDEIFLCVFMIDVFFRSGKYCASFDVNKRGLLMMAIMIWGLQLMIAILCEDYDLY